mmetsp:Transcript_84450/g.236392  ORF Transcript_84450/g.236392 Transcript_84450/m.236392 type:complete len:256 (-) Transcript_84450:1785-2552(-)
MPRQFLQGRFQMSSFVVGSRRTWSLQYVRAIFSSLRSSKLRKLCIVSSSSVNVTPRTFMVNMASVTPCQPFTSLAPGQIDCSGLVSHNRLPMRSTRLKTWPPESSPVTTKSGPSAARSGATSATRSSKPTSRYISHSTGVTARAWKAVNCAAGAPSDVAVTPLMACGASGALAILMQHGMHRPLASHVTALLQSLQPCPSHTIAGKDVIFESTTPSRSRKPRCARPKLRCSFPSEPSADSKRSTLSFSRKSAACR